MSERIVITMGDPAGVGAEVILKALSDPEIAQLASWIVIGDEAPITATGKTIGIDPHALPFKLVCGNQLASKELIAFGQLRKEYGLAAVEYVRRATLLCMEGKAAAMVTAPINKEAVTLSGMPFSGHTEYIAGLCGATESRMLLASKKISTIHVTTHVPLASACQIDPQRLERTIELGDQAMRLMLGRAPRIGVCGLNPHAGEHSLFGRQEEDIIAPSIKRMRERGFDCTGPHAPDSIYVRGLRGEFDLIVAMYHDQGHIPMKIIDFKETVNVTVGIPIIRTSVDHGTAFGIANKNLADASNMKAAMRLAVRMAKERRVQSKES
jgi:4-phospho-D-threonate 3-dehydrogenase / 4-phospho-D-erythronate 3-dehydrogenase